MMMKSKLIIAAAFLSAALAVPVNAADITGEWYGSPYGVDMRLTLSENNTYVRDKTEDGMTEYGTWRLDGDKLILDEGNEIEMVFDYTNDKLSAETGGIYYMFTREEQQKEEEKEKETADETDFEGEWQAYEINSGEVTAGTDVFKIDDMNITVKDGKVSMNAESEFLQKPLKKDPVDGEFYHGHLRFELKLVGDKTCRAKCRIMEDGSMKVDFDSDEHELSVRFRKK